MDDRDEQRMGRVWVYIPRISGKRFDDQSLPTYGGTTPDRQEVDLEFDAKLRSGWIMVSPMSPFFGSDGFRNATAPDGRNSQGGDVNSYGMWRTNPGLAISSVLHLQAETQTLVTGWEWFHGSIATGWFLVTQGLRPRTSLPEKPTNSCRSPKAPPCCLPWTGCLRQKTLHT